METSIKAASIFRAAENGKRVVNLVANTSVFHHIKRETWEKEEVNNLYINYAQMMHFIMQDDSDLGLDIQFALMNANDAQIETILNGATIDINEELVDAGTVITMDDGTEIVAAHDFYRVTTFTIKSVTLLGRVAIDYDGKEDFNPRSKECRAAYMAIAKAARKA